MLSRLVLVWAFAVLAALVQGSTDLVPSALSQARSQPITLAHIHRRLAEISYKRRDEKFQNSTSLDKTFNGVTLYKFESQQSKNFTETEKSPKGTADAKKGGDKRDGAITQDLQTSTGVEIICSRCYTKGLATATLQLNGEFNASAVYHEFEDSVSDTLDQIKAWIRAIDVDVHDMALDIPAPNITFDLDIPVFPGAMIEFQFDGIEMFVELEIVLGAGLNYRLNMYKSKEMGIELAEDLFLGLVFSIDLILTAESEIAITSGFHIRLDDGALVRLALFAKETSDIDLKGGKFEFLPVTVEAAGAVLRGVIQLSLRSGFSFSSPDLTPGFNIEVGDFNLDEVTTATAGIEARVYANVAELMTNVTANTAKDADCALQVAQEYTFAVGAAAGATAGFAGNVWGPAGATKVAVFSTTLASACAIAATMSASKPLIERASEDDDKDLTTTTLTRKQTYSATLCASSGLVECPATLLTMQKSIRTETWVTAVPSGVEASFPEETKFEVLTTVEFGTNAKSMVSETPTPTPAPSSESGKEDEHDTTEKIKDIVNGKTGGVDNKLIIGLSVGLGVPFLIAIIAGLILWKKRRDRVQYAPAATSVGFADDNYSGVVEVKEPTQEVRSVHDRS